jgi:hypothetical protein
MKKMLRDWMLTVGVKESHEKDVERLDADRRCEAE